MHRCVHQLQRQRAESDADARIAALMSRSSRSGAQLRGVRFYEKILFRFFFSRILPSVGADYLTSNFGNYNRDIRIFERFQYIRFYVWIDNEISREILMKSQPTV